MGKILRNIDEITDPKQLIAILESIEQQRRQLDIAIMAVASQLARLAQKRSETNDERQQQFNNASRTCNPE